MTKIYSLSLYQNAIDSLNVGMEMYEKAIEDESKYKFSIIIISNFMELLLKHMVELQNELLIYEKPYDINNKKTINCEQALKILMNSGKRIDKKLEKNIKKLTNLRNEIVHFKFEYNVIEIVAVILYVIKGLRKLYKDISGNDIINDVQENTKLFLHKIKSEYLGQLHQAILKAKAEENDKSNIEIIDCPFCGESKTTVKRNGNKTYCYFCKKTDYEAECSRCGEEFKISDMEYFGKDICGNSLYFCGYCDSLFHKDD